MRDAYVKTLVEIQDDVRVLIGNLEKTLEETKTALFTQNLDKARMGQLLKALLYTFPMTQLQVWLPRWMEALEPTHPVKEALYQQLLEKVRGEYQKCFGPLNHGTPQTSESYQWLDDPWPWEYTTNKEA